MHTWLSLKIFWTSGWVRFGHNNGETRYGKPLEKEIFRALNLKIPGIERISQHGHHRKLPLFSYFKASPFFPGLLDSEWYRLPAARNDDEGRKLQRVLLGVILSFQEYDLDTEAGQMAAKKDLFGKLYDALM